VIFSPPAVRLTSLGIRNVAEDVIEAGRALVQPKDKFYLKYNAFGKINYFGRN
jgi:ABC-type proline/glycine betaine transport system permease subunit